MVTKNELRGFDILILEDEPLIMLDIECTLQDMGARVHCANRLTEAMLLLNKAPISAAVLDYLVSDGTADTLCGELQRRRIPFVIYSGYDYREGMCGRGGFLPKPASIEDMKQLVQTMCLAE